MKPVLLLTLVAFTPVFAESAEALSKLAWLTGDWSGAVGRAKVEEHWIGAAGGAMLGVSRTLAGERMVSFEFLRIETRADGVYYVAHPQARPGTDFKLVSLVGNKATFENPARDFPRRIVYEFDGGDTLTATLEGEEGGKAKKLSFVLKRMPR